jgi:hypothetical protein
MPRKPAKCQKPQNLKGRPQDCTPQQIRKCHGTAKTHRCAPSPKGG